MENKRQITVKYGKLSNDNQQFTANKEENKQIF